MGGASGPISCKPVKARKDLYLIVKTSLSHPLQIAEVRAQPHYGAIGITFCPGKKQNSAYSGIWDRDLSLDLDLIRDWGAAAVVTLVEDHELVSLNVPSLGAEVRARHMRWHHLPIPYVTPPDAGFEQQWLESGEELRSMLRHGFNVLVHCKGGLGRAGTVAARLLVELGVAQEHAVEKVRRVRPGAIETPAQLHHAFGSAFVTEPMPDTSDAAIKDRAIGALLGLAIGDAVGTTLEFSVRDNLPPLTDMIGGGPFKLMSGQWTDDTSMSLALADSLIVHEDFNARDLMMRFVKWYEEGAYSCTGHCFDIGITTRQALMRFKTSRDPMAGSSDPRSAGNGSLMRLAPIAIRYFEDRAKLKDAAARQSWTTHAAPEAVDACIAYAELMADGISGARKSEILARRQFDGESAITNILAGSWRGKGRAAIKSSGYVVHSLEAAIWSTGRTAKFEDAVLLSANLGDDADTTAAITGQLAGAIYGQASLPSHWLKRLAWADKIENMATALFEKARQA